MEKLKYILVQRSIPTNSNIERHFKNTSYTYSDFS